MEDFAGYAGRLLADRYRLPRPPSEEYEFAESLAWDTASGQEVLVRQVPLPEVIEAEVVDDGYGHGGEGGPGGGSGRLRGSTGRATRRPADPVVRRAVEAAVAASRVPDHPRLDQVFDVFVEGDGLWIVSELVPARPLAALLADRPLGAHRAAEIAADLLAALRVVHAHGWAHRNITARTVLICEDGRALLTGLAVGAAEEALCGYDPLPEPGRVPAPPTGDIPDGPDASGGSAGPAAGGGGAAGVARPGGEDPGPAPGELGNGAGNGNGGPGREPAASPYHDTIPYGGARGPATWTGSPLPEGFAARPDGPPGGDDARGRGIFGFEGMQPDEDAGRGGEPVGGPGGQAPHGQGGHTAPSGVRNGPGARGDGSQAPVAHGYGTAGAPGLRGAAEDGDASARAARRGAIAAYRAGTQRAAAETRDGADERGPGARRDDGASQRPAADWWSTAPVGPGHGRGTGAGMGTGTGTDAGGALDDDVRWLSSAEDEVRPDALGGGGARGVDRDEIYGPRAAGPYVTRPDEDTGPTALPGARQGGSRSVRATWRTETYAGDEETGDAPYAPDANDPYGASDGYGANESYGASDGYGANEPYGANDGYGTDGQYGASDQNGAYDEYGSYDGDPDGTGDGDGGAERWGGEEASEGRYRGPATALAAERARHTRMTVVGPVTERWAPEQAGPVYENWRLAPPVGPAADLWALGALLFRAVQGHAPYPEDSAAELVQMVCAEPPAFAEDCGPLRPVVESLMRQDPTERPDFEELRGWLRSLIRSAPEPEVGQRTVTAPPSLEAPAPADPRRLPIVRRRGELVRRRKAEKRPVVSERRQRHKREREKPQRSPRRLGRLIVGLVLLGMAAAVAYAMWFMPEQSESGGAQKGSVVVPDEPEEKPQGGEDGGTEGEPGGKEKDQSKDKDKGGESGKGGKGGGDKDEPSGDRPPSGTGSAKAPKGYKTSRDPAGFQIAVPKEWDRRSTNGKGQVLYNGGDVTMIIVNGRDTAKKYGKNPSAYQNDDEPELSAYRASDWTSTTGLRRIDVGDTPMAEGTFKWKDGGGRELYARNRAVLLDGRYHVLLVQGSQGKKKEIDRHFEAVADTYRVT
ncbi:protein kinase [Streptomyces albiaxialis]|uniref:Protein kinase n=1 Tax=Streptomyces albiaxialis TaxID=329523 RepID=A0ABN2VWL8_9ACTN